jgi:prepilin signal peptidase PulO-like enzyme (type II secretory pathway)
VSSVADTPAVEEAPSKPIASLAVPPGVLAVVAIALAAGCFVKFEDVGRAVVAAGFCAVLSVLAAFDLERRIIPNRVVVPAGILVLVGDIAVEPDRAAEWTIAALATLAVGVLISLASRGGIGMGDAKLGFLLGAGLGWSVLAGLVYASLALFVAAVVVLVRNGAGARKDTLPFGPFLALGAVLALFLS